VPTVHELTELYERFMLGPRAGPGVCERCFNLTDGHQRCYACQHCEDALAAFAPISYSVAHEHLHHTLASYKRLTGQLARRLAIDLAAVLWRYLDVHEACVACAAGAGTRDVRCSFDLVTTVPSGDRERDQRHPLRWIVGELVRPTRGRHRMLLRRSRVNVRERGFDPAKYSAVDKLHGESVLLIDDTWTTGANAQSAAAALKSAGAGPVGAVVIGRHINREWHQNDLRLSFLPAPFDWDTCALCAPAGRGQRSYARVGLR
jgi:predicted amidophosphoribosyltransferase